MNNGEGQVLCSGEVKGRGGSLSFHGPRVYVTVLVAPDTWEAASVALREYVMVKLPCATLDIPVTRFCAAVVRETAPAEVPPDGAPRVTLRVTPEGMALANCPVTLRALLFVVTE